MLGTFLRLAVVGSVLLVPAAADAQGRPAAVGVQIVEARTLSETVPVFAEIVTARNGAVASRVAGSIDTIHVLAGEAIEEGDLLVEHGCLP